MLGQPVVAMHKLNRFYQQHVLVRKAATARNIGEICNIISDILKEVESQEPRFISTLRENNGHYEVRNIAIMNKKTSTLVIYYYLMFLGFTHNHH